MSLHISSGQKLSKTLVWQSESIELNALVAMPPRFLCVPSEIWQAVHFFGEAVTGVRPISLGPSFGGA